MFQPLKCRLPNFLRQQIISRYFIFLCFYVKGRPGRRRRKLLDDLKERRGYSHLNEEALDRTVWRARFGRGFGPLVRGTAIWMNEWTNECLFHTQYFPPHCGPEVTQCLTNESQGCFVYAFLRCLVYTVTLSEYTCPVKLRMFSTYVHILHYVFVSYFTLGWSTCCYCCCCCFYCSLFAVTIKTLLVCEQHNWRKCREHYRNTVCIEYYVRKVTLSHNTVISCHLFSNLANTILQNNYFGEPTHAYAYAGAVVLANLCL